MMFRSRRIWIVIDRVTIIALLVASGAIVWKLVLPTVAAEPLSQPAAAGIASDAPVSPIQSASGRLPSDVVKNAAGKGESTAKAAIVEFSDYQCPFCARFAKESYPEIERQLIDTGKAQYRVLNLPLEHSHPAAFAAAKVAECAREEGKFWDVRDRLFANQAAFDASGVLDSALNAGVESERLHMCLGDQRVSRMIKTQQNEAQRMGVIATPTFIVGYVEDDGSIQAVKKIVGAHTADVFSAAIDSLALAKHTH
jgi:protein-disulfide isomerase